MSMVERLHADLEPLRQIKASKELKGRRVLVVEDDPGDAELMASHLMEIGLNVDTAASQGFAISKLKEHEPYRMVFIDLILGNDTAAKLIGLLREFMPTIPITVVTGYIDDKITAFFNAMGCKIIKKPASKDDLIEAF